MEGVGSDLTTIGVHESDDCLAGIDEVLHLLAD
jgi:hypothetical protein